MHFIFFLIVSCLLHTNDVAHINLGEHGLEFGPIIGVPCEQNEFLAFDIHIAATNCLFIMLKIQKTVEILESNNSMLLGFN